MGTIVEKMQAAINSKNAIKEKFKLADDLPFSQYAENIQGATSFYKCANAYSPPISGLLFDAPLTENSTDAETGQVLTYNGVTFTEIDGKKCAYFNGSSYIQFADTSLPTGSADRTICCWLKQTTSGGWQHAFGYGANSQNSKFYIGVISDGYIGFTQFGSDFYSDITASNWHFVAVVQTNDMQKMYIDGEEVTSGHLSVNTVLSTGYIGRAPGSDSSENFKGYISDTQIYDSALSASQIAKLYVLSKNPKPALPENTWNGYKAILTTAEDGNEYYTFEETVTEGLTFSDIHFAPVIGGIYNDGCTIMVEKLSQYKEKIPFRLTAAQNNASVRLDANGSPDASQLYYRTFINGTFTDWALYTVGTKITLPTMDVDYIEFENRQAKFSTDSNNYFSFNFYGSDYTKVSPSGDIMSLHGYTEECSPYCFYALFRESYGLVGEITLSATTLANSCYQNMINSGQSGEQGLAVNIMATTLADNAMNSLMANCGTITSIRVKFTEWQPDNAFSNWVYFPAGFNGTFYKPTALPDERGSSRIPYNATVVNE